MIIIMIIVMCAALDQIYYGLFSFPLWLCTIVFMGLSILLGLASIGFALFNVFGRPIETITGPMGLYLWNILACEYSVSLGRARPCQTTKAFSVS